MVTATMYKICRIRIKYILLLSSLFFNMRKYEIYLENTSVEEIIKKNNEIEIHFDFN